MPGYVWTNRLPDLGLAPGIREEPVQRVHVALLGRARIAPQHRDQHPRRATARAVPLSACIISEQVPLTRNYIGNSGLRLKPRLKPLSPI